MIHIFNPLTSRYAEFLRKLITDALKHQEIFTWALSGGNTPKGLFQELANNYYESIPWMKIHFFWGDERCVPPDHEDSNYFQAYKHLLVKVPVDLDHIHRIKGENNPQDESVRYSKVLENHLRISDGIPSFDLNMLGIGADGHTASIFPGQEHILSSTQWCEVATHPQSGQKRVSITGQIINHAKDTHILASGTGKASIVHEIINGSKSYPAGLINPKNGIHWILDEEAAALLK